MWPGFGDNMRVIEWMIKRCFNKTGAHETACGLSPRYQDMNWKGLAMTEKQFDALMAVDKDLAEKDVANQAVYYEQFLTNDKLPLVFDAELVLLENRLVRG